MEAQKFDNAKAHEYVQAKYVGPRSPHARADYSARSSVRQNDLPPQSTNLLRKGGRRKAVL
jgi:hypothetical protein